MPMFPALAMRDSFKNVSFAECVTTSMARVLHTLLKAEPSNTVPNNVKPFCDKHRKDAKLIDKDMWDRDVVHHMGFEFAFSANI